MKAIVIAFVMMFATTVSAQELTKQQQTKQNIFHAVSVADAVTTIVGVSRGFVEANGVLGPSPDPASVIVFFIARNTAHHVATERLIPVKWRDAWLNTWIGAQTIVVLRNIAILR